MVRRRARSRSCTPGRAAPARRVASIAHAPTAPDPQARANGFAAARPASRALLAGHRDLLRARLRTGGARRALRRCIAPSRSTSRFASVSGLDPPPARETCMRACRPASLVRDRARRGSATRPKSRSASRPCTVTSTFDGFNDRECSFAGAMQRDQRVDELGRAHGVAEARRAAMRSGCPRRASAWARPSQKPAAARNR